MMDVAKKIWLQAFDYDHKTASRRLDIPASSVYERFKVDHGRFVSCVLGSSCLIMRVVEIELNR